MRGIAHARIAAPSEVIEVEWPRHIEAEAEAEEEEEVVMMRRGKVQKLRKISGS